MEDNRNLRRRNAWLANRASQAPESGDHSADGHRKALRVEPLASVGEVAHSDDLGEKMADVNLSKQELQDMMASILQVALRENNKLNPLEQKKYDEEVAKEKRRSQMVVALGQAEEQAMKQKKGRCSHSRWPA